MTDNHKAARDTALNEAIDYLFQNAHGERAERLALITSDKRDLGGWSRSPVKAAIARIWDAALAHADKQHAESVWALKEYCFATFRGGYHDEKEYKIFAHGMQTVFNALEKEYRSKHE